MRELIFFLLFLSVSQVLAQKQRSLSLYPGITVINIRDNFSSTITYKAILPAGKIAYSSQDSFFIDEKAIDFCIGKLRQDVLEDNIQKYFQFNIEWNRVYQLKKGQNKGVVIYFGGNWINSYSNSIHSLFNDHQTSFMFYSAIGPSVLLRYSINERNILSSNFNFMCLGYVVRPAYSMSIPEKSITGDWNIWNIASGGNFVSLGRFRKIKSSINLIHKFNLKFSSIIKYEWDFVEYNGQNRIYRANHFLTAGLNYIF